MVIWERRVLVATCSKSRVNNLGINDRFINGSHNTFEFYTYKRTRNRDVGTTNKTSTVTIGRYQKTHRRITQVKTHPGF
jgi:hypothetical protein